MLISCNKSGRLNVLLLLMVIFLIALLLNLKNNFLLSWDLVSYYLPNAKILAENPDFLYPFGELWTERPVFELLLTIAFSIFDDPLQGAALIVGSIGAMYIFSGALLAFRLMGMIAALVSVLLILFSPNIIFWAPRHIDALWPIWLFFTIYLFFLPKSNFDFSIGAIAGFLTTMSLFTKEISFLFIPAYGLLWLVGVVPRYSERLIGYYFISLIGLILWVFYFKASPVPQSASGVLHAQSAIDIVSVAFLGLYKYYFPVAGGRLFMYFALAPFLLLSLFYCFVASIYMLNKPHFFQPEKVIACCIILFLPFDALVGINEFRISQNLFSLMLTHFALGLMIWRICNSIQSVVEFQKIDMAMILAVVLLVGGLVAQLYADKTTIRNSYQNSALISLKNGKWPSYTLRGSEVLRWFRQHEINGANVIIDYKPVRAALNLVSDHQYVAYPLPLKGLGYARLISNMGFDELALSEPVTDASLLLSPQRSKNKLRHTDWLAVLSIGDLDRFVKGKNITHLVLPNKTAFNYSALRYFLSHFQGVELVASVNESNVLYEIYSIERDAFEINSLPPALYTSEETKSFVAFLEGDYYSVWTEYHAILGEVLTFMPESESSFADQLRVISDSSGFYVE